MGLTSLETESFKILELLAFQGRLNFQQMVTRMSTGRNTTRKKLNGLIRSGLVREENRGKWKRGMRLVFVITKKGERRLFEVYTDDLNTTLRKTCQIVSKNKENRLAIRHFRQAAFESIIQSIDDNRPFDFPNEPPQRNSSGEWQRQIARWDRHRTTQRRIFGPLEDSFRLILGLIVEVLTSDVCDSDLITRALHAIEIEPVVHIILPLERLRVELNLIDKSAETSDC
jgi:predicted transcriptional regulator